MEDKFTYDRKGYLKAIEYLDSIKDIIKYPTFSNDGLSIVQYANYIYKRLNS